MMSPEGVVELRSRGCWHYKTTGAMEVEYEFCGHECEETAFESVFVLSAPTTLVFVAGEVASQSSLGVGFEDVEEFKKQDEQRWEAQTTKQGPAARGRRRAGAARVYEKVMEARARGEAARAGGSDKKKDLSGEEGTYWDAPEMLEVPKLGRTTEERKTEPQFRYRLVGRVKQTRADVYHFTSIFSPRDGEAYSHDGMKGDGMAALEGAGPETALAGRQAGTCRLVYVLEGGADAAECLYTLRLRHAASSFAINVTDSKTFELELASSAAMESSPLPLSRCDWYHQFKSAKIQAREHGKWKEYELEAAQWKQRLPSPSAQAAVALPSLASARGCKGRVDASGYLIETPEPSEDSEVHRFPLTPRQRLLTTALHLVRLPSHWCTLPQVATKLLQAYRQS